MSARSDHLDGLVKSALRRAGLDAGAGYFMVTTRTVPWNANQWAYHHRTTVAHTDWYDAPVPRVVEVLGALDDVVDVSHGADARGTKYVRVVWR